MDLVIERPVFEPDDGHFLYWKPGGMPYSEPDGLAWRLDPGSDLVLNAHMQPSGKPEQVRPSIGLYFTDKPHTQFPDAGATGTRRRVEYSRRAIAIFWCPTISSCRMDVDVLAVYPHAHDLGHVLEGRYADAALDGVSREMADPHS